MESEDILEGIAFNKIQNLNEARVLATIPQILQEFKGFSPNKIDIEDIYALSLNKLPARYVQEGSLLLNDLVTDEMVEEAVREAIHSVSASPTISEKEDDLSLDSLEL